MDRIMEIDQRIAELQRAYDDVEGTETEIYTRIVGYYRSLKNWNKGKREEYDHRLTFSGGGSPAADVSGSPAPSAEPVESIPSTPAATGSSSERDQTPDAEGTHYLYFFRSSCPNCPPVKQRLESSGISGINVDVDTENGIAQAITHQVLATPTVVLLNADGSAYRKLTSLAQVEDALASVV